MNKKIAINSAVILISILTIISKINAQILTPNASEEDKRAAQALINRTNSNPTSSLNRAIITDNGQYVTRGIIPSESVFRKPTKKELATLKPEQADLDSFADFLRQEKTGLIKLINGKGCLDRGLVDASADCFQYTVPGNAASYSFRIPTYRVAELGDLTFEDGNFKCLGKYVQGIMTAIGDISLDKVGLQTQGVGFLAKFQPESKVKSFEEKRRQFSKGVNSDSFIYRNTWNLIENTTYVLRSIAYKGSFFDRNSHNLFLDLDKRKDIIVAFRVVRQSDDGSITILWKELSRKGSPALK